MWVPCHHDTAPPQVAAVEHGLQIRRVAANMLNKHSRHLAKLILQLVGRWANSPQLARGNMS
jgi:hypothetical protein